jgi:hypothetical protein
MHSRQNTFKPEKCRDNDMIKSPSKFFIITLKYPMYFGHPINTYNTSKEAELITAIKKEFPEVYVENPNQPHHAEGYKEWEEQRGNGIGYFIEEVLPEMYAGIFLAFEDGMWSKGVYTEAKAMHENGKPVYQIDWNRKIWILDKLEPEKCLSVEETRKRVYKN